MRIDLIVFLHNSVWVCVHILTYCVIGFLFDQLLFFLYYMSIGSALLVLI